MVSTSKTKQTDKKPEFSFEQRVVSPKGVAKYPKLNKPDEFQGKKTYKVTLILDENEPFVASLREANAEVLEHFQAEYRGKKDKKGKSIEIEEYDPITVVTDEDGDPTGKVEVTFKMNYQRADGTINKPILLDAKRTPLPKSVLIYGGSEVKVAGYLSPFCMVNGAKGQAGISLKLSAVQVLELSTGGGSGTFGFDEEDGFEAQASGFASEDDEDEETNSASEF